MNISWEVVNELQNLLKANLIGTGLLYSKDLIETVPKDLDIAVDKTYIEIARKILHKNGYVEITERGKQIGYDNQRRCAQWEIIHTGVFKKTGYIDIHLVEKTEDFELWKPKKIIAKKLERCKKKDLELVIEFCSKKLNHENLLHYLASTTGLYCIDRNPKDVSYEWICENNFRLGE